MNTANRDDGSNRLSTGDRAAPAHAQAGGLSGNPTMTVRSRATVSVKAHYHRPEHKLSIEQITSRTPCEIHLRFEAWSNVARKAVPVPQGIPVDLVDHRPDGTVHTMLTGATDASGHVAFAFDLEALGRPKPDVAFVVRSAGHSSADIVLPETWSSKERKTVNGRPGFYPGYEGEPIARDVAPLTFAMPVPAKFYLQFEVWDLVETKFVPLPEGVPVDLVDYDYVPLTQDEVLATANTDAAGRVQFEIPDLTLLDEPRPDIYFVVRSGGIAYANHEKLPEKWSTKGWLAADGAKPGFHPDFPGGTIGSPNAPVVFRIGLDIHLAVKYKNQGTGNYTWAPPGVVVNIRRNYLLGKGPLLATLTTDLKGQVHGVIFDARSEDDIAVEVVFETSDAAIGLPKSKIAVSPWIAKTFEKKGYTSLPWPPSSALSLFAETDDRNVALYFLKILRELHGFLWHITDGKWTGVEDLTIHTRAPNGSGSWPVKSVWIARDDNWDRGTIVHELAHQVVWKEANYSDLGIVYEAIPCIGQYFTTHSYEWPKNPEHAFIEGWPEFIQAIFAGPSNVFRSRRSPEDPADPFAIRPDVEDEDGKKVSMQPLPLNKGESLEGAFAIGLYRIFREHVLAGKYSALGPPLVRETVDGDVSAPGWASWVTDPDVQQRFLDMIWKPLKALHDESNPTTTLYLEKMREINSGRWHELSADLHRLFMAMAKPTITSIQPAEGARMSTNTIKVFGSNFVKGMAVCLGSIPAARIDVKSDSELEVDTPPLDPGKHDIEVEITANSYRYNAMLPEAYESK